MELDSLTPHCIRECNVGKQRECWADAWYLWIEMKYIGNVVSGFRKDFDIEFPHYWLELGDFLYTNGMCELKNGDMEWVMLTYKKDIYYKHHNITINKIFSENESLASVIQLKNMGYLK